MVETERVLLAELESLAPASDVPLPDWQRVTKRLESSASRTSGYPTRLVAAVAVAAVMAVAAASAAYLSTRGAPSGAVANGQLVIDSQPREVAQLSLVGADGRLQTLWRCPRAVFCGGPAGMSWSPDGKRIALVMATLGRTSFYEGLDVLTVSTHRFTHVSTSRLCQGNGFFGLPGGVDWSPDGRWIAFTCGSSRIALVHPSGAGARVVATGLTNVRWPSWSPDGRRLAFSAGAVDHSWIYVVNSDGTHRRRLARGRAPSWSPNAPLIAYRGATHGPSCGGVRLVNADTGRDSSPASAMNPCHQFGPRGTEAPQWSPDGTEIAVGSTSGLYVTDADGTNLRLITHQSPYSGQPAWRPAHGVPNIKYGARAETCSEC